MWAIEGSLNANMRHPLTNKQKEALFTELLLECKHSAPGARFTAKLRTSLERLLLPARKELCGRVKDGCAPLFISCKRGNLEIVEYLITVCGVDIEQRGFYEVPDDRSVHRVTPLWCAAVSGKLEVIRCLVRHGADINAGSDSGSTPVRSACFMTHLDIVRFLVENGANICQANHNGGTCLINSVQSAKLCTFLLENGAQVNATDMQNKTALHYAIQEHRRPNPIMTLYRGEVPKLDNVVETTKLLLDNGADPYAVSRSGDDALQTACLKGATQIFSLLTGRIQYSHERMADAHELIGSTLLDDFNDIMYAMQHWRIANRIRNSAPHYIAKRPHMPPRVAYRQAVEFTSEAELDIISTDIDAMRIQSLLICERVLGIAHKDTVFRLMYRGASYADALRYQRCIDLWMWALSIRIERDSILYTDTCYSAQAIVKIMIDLKVGRLDLTADDFIDTRYLPRFCDVVNTFNMLTGTLKETRSILDVRPVYKKQSEMFDRTLKCITHLIFLLLATATTPETRLKTKELVTNLVAMNVRSSYTGDTLLHLSVSRLNVIKSTYFAEDMDVRPIFPDWGVAKLLLDCGSNVNAKNESKSTPLHVASIPYNFSNKLIHLLLEYDAHVDQPNKFGDSPAYLIQTNPLNDVFLLKHVNLKCLAANVVVANHIPYDNGQIPMTLVPFVRFHEP